MRAIVYGFHTRDGDVFGGSIHSVVPDNLWIENPLKVAVKVSWLSRDGSRQGGQWLRSGRLCKYWMSRVFTAI